MRGSKKLLIAKSYLLLAALLLLFTSCADGVKTVMVVPPYMEHFSLETIDGQRITNAYLKSVHNLSVVLERKNAEKGTTVKIAPNNVENVRQAFANRSYQLLHNYCEKNGISVVFYTLIGNARADGFFQVETHFFDDRSNGVYHFRPYMKVDAKALYLTSFWDFKLREMYQKLSGEQL